MVKKDDLKPGMKVRNNDSGKVGLLVADYHNPKKISGCVSDDAVVVSVIGKSKCYVRTWNLTQISVQM